MNYRLKIYGITGTGTPVTTLTTPDFSVRGWSHVINGAGSMSFSMQKSNAKATADLLQKQRQVTLLRQASGVFVPIFHGFLRAEREIGNEKVVECVGLFENLSKRETAENETFNGQGSTEVFDLLAATNADDDTGIVAGTGGVTTTRALTASGFQRISDAIDMIATAHGAEYEVDENKALNFVPSLGSDKSATVELIFRRDGTPGNNLDSIEIGEDATNLATRVIGYTSAGLSYQYDNATAQTKYGLLIERKQFNEAQDLDTLTAMTTTYGEQRSSPLSEFVATPSLASKKYLAASGVRSVVGLEYGDVRTGDLVTVTVVTGNTSISTPKRIAEITVNVSKGGRETMSFTFADQDVYVTAALIERAKARAVESRLSKLEQA